MDGIQYEKGNKAMFKKFSSHFAAGLSAIAICIPFRNSLKNTPLVHVPEEPSFEKNIKLSLRGRAEDADKPSREIVFQRRKHFFSKACVHILFLPSFRKQLG